MDIVPMPYLENKGPAHLPVWSTEQNKCTGNEEDCVSPSSMYGAILQPVPIIIVGSHFDQVVMQNRDEVINNTQRLVAEMKDRYCLYIMCICCVCGWVGGWMHACE